MRKKTYLKLVEYQTEQVERHFSMLNSSGNKKKKKGTLFLSHKKGIHGFGLGRVEAILKEHGGWCKYNSEDGAFTSEFLVPAIE